MTVYQHILYEAFHRVLLLQVNLALAVGWIQVPVILEPLYICLTRTWYLR